jgi:hypothetical protein
MDVSRLVRYLPFLFIYHTILLNRGKVCIDAYTKFYLSDLFFLFSPHISPLQRLCNVILYSRAHHIIHV